MSIRITDLNEIMQGQHKGSGYISIGNEKFPNLLTIYFGMKDKPTRKEAEALANSLVGSKALEACS